MDSPEVSSAICSRPELIAARAATSQLRLAAGSAAMCRVSHVSHASQSALAVLPGAEESGGLGTRGFVRHPPSFETEGFRDELRRLENHLRLRPSNFLAMGNPPRGKSEGRAWKPCCKNPSRILCGRVACAHVQPATAKAHAPVLRQVSNTRLHAGRP